jgi:hypothetical protein
VKQEPVLSSADPRASIAINCTDELSTQLEELFDKMPSSDVNFNIGGRQFPAHKNILAARSEIFDAMFKHPMKKQSTNNQIKIEDTGPEVFEQLLRFIYTGRVSTATNHPAFPTPSDGDQSIANVGKRKSRCVG